MQRSGDCCCCWVMIYVVYSCCCENMILKIERQAIKKRKRTIFLKKEAKHNWNKEIGYQILYFFPIYVQ